MKLMNSRFNKRHSEQYMSDSATKYAYREPFNFYPIMLK